MPMEAATPHAELLTLITLKNGKRCLYTHFTIPVMRALNRDFCVSRATLI